MWPFRFQKVLNEDVFEQKQELLIKFILLCYKFKPFE